MAITNWVEAPNFDGTGTVNSPSLPQHTQITHELAPNGDGTGVPNGATLPYRCTYQAVSPGGIVVVTGGQQHWGSS